MPKRRRTALWGISFVAAVLLYYAWIGRWTAHEGILAFIFAGISTALGALTWKISATRFSPTLNELAEGWRLPWYVAADTWVLTIALAKDLLNILPAGSFMRATHFASCQSLSCVVLATSYTSISPNSVVLGVDAEERLLVFHQIVRSDLSRMVQNLGAGR